jgi:hypothetical protein
MVLFLTLYLDEYRLSGVTSHSGPCFEIREGSEAAYFASWKMTPRVRRWPEWSLLTPWQGGEGAADIYSLIVTAQLNDCRSARWPAHVLRVIAEQPNHRLANLLSWNWCKPDNAVAA